MKENGVREEWWNNLGLILCRRILLAGNNGERKNDQKKSEKYFHASQLWGHRKYYFLINNP